MQTAPKVRTSRNWKEYNHNLKKRGVVIFSFNKDDIHKFYHQGTHRKGGKRCYSAAMYEYVLTIKVFLRLPWRAAIGFVEGLLKNAFPQRQMDVPDYAHACREAAKLSLRVKPVLFAREGMELAFDSTGINVYSTSGWHQRKHGKAGQYREKDQWKKIHVALDLETMQVQSMAFTSSTTNDCEVVSQLCNAIVGKVNSVRADGAYDTKEVYQIVEKWNAKALIPPASTSKAQHELTRRDRVLKTFLVQRDEIINQIRQYETFNDGLKHWKQNSGYHRRSLIEAWMSRLKKSFGFSLQHKTESARKNEIITKINLLNRMVAT